jgi:hypothetical protein
MNESIARSEEAKFDDPQLDELQHSLKHLFLIGLTYPEVTVVDDCQ